MCRFRSPGTPLALQASYTFRRRTTSTCHRHGLSSRRCRCSQSPRCLPPARGSLAGILDTHLKWHQSPLNIDLPNSCCTQRLRTQSCTSPPRTQHTNRWVPLSQRCRCSPFPHACLRLNSNAKGKLACRWTHQCSRSPLGTVFLLTQ